MEEIGKILPKVLETELSRLDPPVIEVLAPLWSRVAGKPLAKECRPVAFSGGTLTLATKDADWAEPLRQMAEEIRTHVNNFLGRPVVRHLKISCVSKFDSRGAPLWRKDWPGQVCAMPANLAQGIGRPPAKHSGRNRGKVY